MGHHGRTVAQALGLKGDLAKQAEKLVSQLYTAFIAKDMDMLEINPLIVSKQGELKCLDAKMSFDSNSLYRHLEIVALRDPPKRTPRKSRRRTHDLAYIASTAPSAPWSTAAGLAMATLDIIKLYGESPASFLDVGGGASERR